MVEEDESSQVLEANFDSFSAEDMLEAAFGVDDDVVEQPEDAADDADEDEEAITSEPVCELLFFRFLFLLIVVCRFD